MRLRVNSWRSALTTGINNSTTTIDGLDVGGFNLPTVASPNYLVIIIDPQATEGLPEIVHLTAHTSGNASGTVVRGAEGSTALAHSAGVEILVGPTVQDLIRTPNDFALPNADDYEFDASSTALPSGWAWVNQGGASYVEADGLGSLIIPASGSDSWRIIKRAIPASTWTAVLKFSHAAANNGSNHGGLILRESSSGKFVAIGYDGTLDTNIYKWTNETTYAGSGFVTLVNASFGSSSCPLWIKVTRHSNTNWDFWLSSDGGSWAAILIGADLSSFLTIDEIGFGATLRNAGGVSADHLRFT